jgi:hypothetical protein
MNAMPNKLRLKDGHLEMVDGSDPADYLRSSPIPDGSDVVVMKREHADQMARNAHAYRALMDARFALAA